MNYCMNKNLWLLLDSNDPADELLWLVFELQLAELKGEKVVTKINSPYNWPSITFRFTSWVTSPPAMWTVWGSGAPTSTPSSLAIPTQSPVNSMDTLTLMSFSFSSQRRTRWYVEEKNILRVLTFVFQVNNVAYIAPAVTPYHGGNPAYRLYEVGKG